MATEVLVITRPAVARRRREPVMATSDVRSVRRVRIGDGHRPGCEGPPHSGPVRRRQGMVKVVAAAGEHFLVALEAWFKDLQLAAGR
jgi:hypothetical protein